MGDVLSLLIITIVARRCPPFDVFPHLGRNRSASCLPDGLKRYQPLLSQKYSALPQNSIGLSFRQRHHDPPGLFTTDERVALHSFVSVGGGLHSYVFPSF